MSSDRINCIFNNLGFNGDLSKFLSLNKTLSNEHGNKSVIIGHLKEFPNTSYGHVAVEVEVNKAFEKSFLLGVGKRGISEFRKVVSIFLYLLVFYRLKQFLQLLLVLLITI